MSKKNKIKTKISVANEVWGDRDSREEFIIQYEKYFKKSGYLLDEDLDDVYKIIDKEIHLNEGDYFDNIYKVVYKNYDSNENCYYYSLELI